MKTVTVRVPVTIEVSLDYPEAGHYTMPGFHMEYATINEPESIVDKVDVSVVLPSEYYFHLREKRHNHQHGGSVDFKDAILHIINRWEEINAAADCASRLMEEDTGATIDL